jgi:hypothetical protein
MIARGLKRDLLSTVSPLKFVISTGGVAEVEKPVFNKGSNIA